MTVREIVRKVKMHGRDGLFWFNGSEIECFCLRYSSSKECQIARLNGRNCERGYQWRCNKCALDDRDPKECVVDAHVFGHGTWCIRPDKPKEGRNG